MSHEIRTPMDAILGLAHLLGQADVTPHRVQQLGKIEAAAQHLLSILNDMLDLSKIEAGKLELEERNSGRARSCSRWARLWATAPRPRAWP